MLEPDVPEYLIDKRLIRDKRDDPHGAAAPRTEQRVFLPELPYELSPSHASAFEPFALVTVGVIGRTCRRFVAAARYAALPGCVGVEAIVEHESLVRLGDLCCEVGDEVEDVQLSTPI